MSSQLKVIPPSDYEKKVVLVGNPNSGKTTLFNFLTKQNRKTSNFTGTTVNLSQKIVQINEDFQYSLVDLPGLYNLSSTNAEETLAANTLNNHEANSIDLLVYTLPIDNIEASLPLLTQIRELEVPLVIAITMLDSSKELSVNQKFLADKFACPVITFTSKSGNDEQINLIIQNELTLSTNNSCGGCSLACVGCSLQERFHESESLAEQIVNKDANTKKSQLQLTLDRLLLHPIFGFVSFLSIMFLIFYTVFSLASIPMDFIDSGFTWLANYISVLLPESWFRNLLTDGIISGVGGVLVFLPQIFILFFFITALEQSGYLARAACLTDSFLNKIGLSGKAFVPMLSAHACAVPAILSTRIIKNSRDRLLTIFILPLFSCSARLPVYAMLATFLFADSKVKAALAITVCYCLGIITAFFTSLLLSKTFLKSQHEEFLLELPNYRGPNLRYSLKIAYRNSSLFVKKAGTSILAFSILIWFAAYFPNGEINTSYLSMIGKFFEPILSVFGFNWQIGVGILASFSAREVIIPTLTILSGGVSEDSLLQNLQTNGFLTQASAISLLAFYVIALQCVPTQIAVWKETGSMKVVVYQFLYMLGLALLVSFLSFQFLN